MTSPVTQYLNSMLDAVRDQDSGELADYIEKLKNADPDKLALALCTTQGHIYSAGDTEYEFSIQSISKPFVYALALDMYGPEEVHKYVGVEPSGEAFNQLSLDNKGRPANPLINAGAITVNQLIGGPEMPVQARVEKIRDYLSRLAGRELAIDQEIHESEMSTADRNMALAHLLREADMLNDQPHDAVSSYISQCSVLVDVKDLAVMAATLANAGTQPVTGEKILTAEACRVTQAVMVSAGMYDASGHWMVNVGIPAKSGVAGGLIGTMPSQIGIASLSPRLDAQGNSVRGVKLFEELSSALGLNLVSSNFYVAPGIRSVNREDGATVVELQGMINFAAAERNLFDLRRMRIDDRLVLDVSRVTSFNKAGRDLIKDGLMQFRDQGVDVSIYDPENALSDYEFSDGTTARAIREFSTSFSVPRPRDEVFSDFTRPQEWFDSEFGDADVEETEQGTRVVWKIDEEDDSSLVFDFQDDDSGQTKVNLTRRGVNPDEKGYVDAVKGWRDRLLRGLQPILKRGEHAREEDERGSTEMET